MQVMSKSRREFTPEFKQEAVRLLEGSGRPLVAVAAELGIQPSMLRAWRSVIKGTGPSRSAARPAGATILPAGPTAADLASQNAKLKRELDRTRMERDVLKKAIGIFAEMPK